MSVIIIVGKLFVTMISRMKNTNRCKWRISFHILIDKAVSTEGLFHDPRITT